MSTLSLLSLHRISLSLSLSPLLLFLCHLIIITITIIIVVGFRQKFPRCSLHLLRLFYQFFLWPRCRQVWKRELGMIGLRFITSRYNRSCLMSAYIFARISRLFCPTYLITMTWNNISCLSPIQPPQDDRTFAPGTPDFKISAFPLYSCGWPAMTPRYRASRTPRRMPSSSDTMGL